MNQFENSQNTVDMFYNGPQIYRGSDGQLYEVRDSNAEGGLFFFFIAILMAIASAIYYAYLWLLAHYGYVILFSTFGLITWVGWVYHEYQLKEGSKKIFKKIASLLFILFGYSIAFNGFMWARSEQSFMDTIKGEWVETNADIQLKISDDQFVFTLPTDNVIIEADYSYTFSTSNVMTTDLNGQIINNQNTPPTTEPYTNRYSCYFIGDTLKLWAEVRQFSFLKKQTN